MKKSELIEKLAPLDNDAEVLLAIITPKDENEEGFELGAEGDAAEQDEDDDTVDNGDGTVTNFEGIDDIDILENEDPETNVKEKFGAIIIDMAGDDDEDDGDDDTNNQGDANNPA